jgi:hypothetical protein
MTYPKICPTCQSRLRECETEYKCPSEVCNYRLPKPLKRTYPDIVTVNRVESRHGAVGHKWQSRKVDENY